MAVATKQQPVLGYMPDDTPAVSAMLSLGFQQVLTMFPATVLVPILTKFDIGVTLLASGLGTIIALLVSSRCIPLYYGSSSSYIFPIPDTFPNGIPAIVLSAIVGIVLNLLFIALPPSKFGMEERSTLQF